MGLRQVEQGFTSFFCIIDEFSKWSTLNFWRHCETLKNHQICKKRAKNEEKTCSTCFKSIVWLIPGMNRMNYPKTRFRDPIHHYQCNFLVFFSWIHNCTCSLLKTKVTSSELKCQDLKKIFKKTLYLGPNYSLLWWQIAPLRHCTLTQMRWVTNLFFQSHTGDVSFKEMFH